MLGFLRRAAGELLSPAMIVAALALALSLGGTAYAAKLITSRDIKNGTIKVADLSPKAIKQLKGKRGAAGVPGAPGHDATDTIPAGETITGSVYYQIDASANGQSLNQSIAFPARAPAAVVSVGWAPDASPVTIGEDATCTGEYANPTAPPGRVCGYRIGSTNLTSVQLTALAPGADRGFVVRGTAAGAGSVSVDFSWAYTAPAG